jgi:hypothetical protein
VGTRFRGRIKPRDYLAAAASSRGLYRTLVADAVALLPPANPGRKEPERLESFLTLAAMTDALRVSRSTVQADLARLINFGWVESERPRLLGHREGSTLHLLSDLRAREETGEKTLITRYILADLLAVPGTAETPAASEELPPSGRGLAREWRPPK